MANAVVDYLIGPNGTDGRTIGWPLMDWRLSAGISALYVVSIPVGNCIMRHRAPLKLKGFSIVHNAILFSLSLYMAIECVRQSYRNFGWAQRFQLWCNSNDRGPGFSAGFSDSGRALANVMWIHYVSKAYEFVDTWIMILKKNTRQISFLHVYHHASTFFPVWHSVVRFGPGGEAWFCCALNSAIHVLMYGYYFSASLGFKSTAVKKMTTTSQMIQFLAFMTQSIWLLFVMDCYRPRLSPWILLVQCAIFFALFFNFYVKTYGRGGGGRLPAPKKIE